MPAAAAPTWLSVALAVESIRTCIHSYSLSVRLCSSVCVCVICVRLSSSVFVYLHLYASRFVCACLASCSDERSSMLTSVWLSMHRRARLVGGGPSATPTLSTQQCRSLGNNAGPKHSATQVARQHALLAYLLPAACGLLLVVLESCTQLTPYAQQPRVPKRLATRRAHLPMDRRPSYNKPTAIHQLYSLSIEQIRSES